MFPPFFTGKSYWSRLGFLVLFVLSGMIIFGAVAVWLPIVLKLNENSRNYIYVVQTVSSLGLFLCPALLFSYCNSKKLFAYSWADKTTSVSLIGIVILLSLFILPIIAFLGYFNEQLALPETLKNIEIWMKNMEEANKNLLKTLTDNSNLFILILNIVVMALFPALFEEFLFRGTLQPFFTNWFQNKHLAILLTAFIFSFIHFQFYGFIPRFLLGIYLGYLLVWGKSLWLPIVAHFLHNALSLFFDFVAQRKGIDLDTVNPSETVGFYPLVLVCVMCVATGIYLMWRKAR